MTKQAVRKAMDSRLQRYVRLDAMLQRISDFIYEPQRSDYLVREVAVYIYI